MIEVRICFWAWPINGGRKEERKEPIRRTITVRARAESPTWHSAARRRYSLLPPPPQSSAGGADGFREEQVAFSVDGGTEPIQFPSLCDVTTVTDRALVIFIPRFKHRRFSGTAAADSILSCGFLAFRSDFCALLRRSRRGRIASIAWYPLIFGAIVIKIVM